jgi:hypothetical protein
MSSEQVEVLREVMSVLYSLPSCPAEMLGDDLYDRVCRMLGEMEEEDSDE